MAILTRTLHILWRLQFLWFNHVTAIRASMVEHVSMMTLPGVTLVIALPISLAQTAEVSEKHAVPHSSAFIQSLNITEMQF